MLCAPETMVFTHTPSLLFRPTHMFTAGSGCASRGRCARARSRQNASRRSVCRRAEIARRTACAWRIRIITKTYTAHTVVYICCLFVYEYFCTMICAIRGSGFSSGTTACFVFFLSFSIFSMSSLFPLFSFLSISRRTDLFGHWQTDPWTPAAATGDGRVPKNERGNVDLWYEIMRCYLAQRAPGILCFHNGDLPLIPPHCSPTNNR